MKDKKEKSLWKVVDSASGAEIREMMIKDGWSPDYFEQIDELSKKIKTLESKRRRLNKQFCKNPDENVLEEIKTLELEIINLKNKLMEIHLKEHSRVLQLKNGRK
ncbi:MAG: hypothetical protein PHZ04_01295 [Patescibacteria group bacterium]|nr:hypothetical protein [Patescibacteria group bacterium]MDD5294625.1 hypothetical protein [Patescibacteria group bacterium]MDD5554387.1 hypothetical protein [Patescibacteria group bacterium]